MYLEVRAIQAACNLLEERLQNLGELLRLWQRGFLGSFYFEATER